MGRLAVGDRQKVEILKQLLAGARVLILDEPTKVLAPQETVGMFHTIGELRMEGYGLIFISHKLNEVMACADRVVVMRQGRVVGAMPRERASEASLLALMFAEPIESGARPPSAMPMARASRRSNSSASAPRLSPAVRLCTICRFA